MNNSSKTVRIRPKHYSKLHGTSICSFSTELAAILTRNITKFVEEPVWVLVGDPSQTKDASTINLAEKHFVCWQIAQRFRTVGTHHKLTSKPAAMPKELWDFIQMMIRRCSRMSLEQHRCSERQPDFDLQDQLIFEPQEKTTILFSQTASESS